MPHEITTYQPRFKEDFRILNLEWIEKYFRVESKDVEQTSHPEACVNGGGQIFFVVQDGRAVATCALYPAGPGRFELAKMAVSPSHHGRGFGDVLMGAAEDWARAQGAKEIFLLSNTILEPAIRLYEKHGYRTVHLGPHPEYDRANIEMKKDL